VQVLQDTRRLICADWMEDHGMRRADPSPASLGAFLIGISTLPHGLHASHRNGLDEPAPTLWCSAAVGALTGSSFPAQTLIGTLIILAIHLGLRLLGQWVDERRKTALDVEPAA